MFIYIIVLNLWLMYLKKVLAYKSNLNSVWLNLGSSYIINNSATFQDHLDYEQETETNIVQSIMGNGKENDNLLYVTDLTNNPSYESIF